MLLAVVLILAGGLVKRSQPDSDRLQYADQPVAVGQTFHTGGADVTVTHVAFARIVAPHSSDPSDTGAGGLPAGSRRTSGVFLVVAYEVTALHTVPPRTPIASDLSLVAGDGTTYTPADIGTSGGTLITPDPGFTWSRSLVFEVNPTRIDDLTLVFTATQLFSTLSDRYQVDLGTGDQQTAASAARAAGRLFTLPEDTERVAS